VAVTGLRTALDDILPSHAEDLNEVLAEAFRLNEATAVTGQKQQWRKDWYLSEMVV
jgi:hypothetical protein